MGTSLSDATRTLGWEDVQTLLDASQDAAVSGGLRVVVAVVDRGGVLAGLLRHPETYLTSSSVAVAKAFTAANFGASTGDLAERIPEETRADLARVDGRLTFIRGGLPILRDGTVVGGVGVSGASAQQDAEVAEAAVSALDRRRRTGA